MRWMHVSQPYAFPPAYFILFIDFIALVLGLMCCALYAAMNLFSPSCSPIKLWNDYYMPLFLHRFSISLFPYTIFIYDFVLVSHSLVHSISLLCHRHGACHSLHKMWNSYFIHIQQWFTEHLVDIYTRPELTLTVLWSASWTNTAQIFGALAAHEWEQRIACVLPANERDRAG